VDQSGADDGRGQLTVEPGAARRVVARLSSVLTVADRLDPAPRRIALAGAPGAGKTTLARALAPVIDAVAVELDELAHGPGWSIRPEFIADVRAFTAGERWITEWQFDEARPIIAERADTIVWLDLPRWLVMLRLFRRCVYRRWHREVLWGGNMEPPLWTVFVERNHMLRWGWRSIGFVRDQVHDAVTAYPGLRIVRLRSRSEVAAFLAARRAAVPRAGED
jgi:adenylate kinase family enzyme